MTKEVENLWKSEDYWAIWFSVILFASILAGAVVTIPKIGKWTTNPLTAFSGQPLGIAALCLGLAVLFTVGVAIMKADWKRFLGGYLIVFLVSILAFVVSAQKTLHAWGLGYALWGLLFGLIIANTVGTPAWLLRGARSEMFIKTGLVMLGSEILFSKILQLGLPGLIVAWIVTPTVIVFMWHFGTRWLKIPSKTFTIIVAAATSVCGVSAAIAVAGACRAKKEELTLAVGMTMIFTVLMMVVMPAFAKLVGMDPQVAGAWLGGTIDSTGAVVAAGALLGDQAEKVAAVVKMIQNVLIGAVAFAVAVFWVARVDRDPKAPKPSLFELWYRFPKFILGFVAASLVFSFLLGPLFGDDAVSVTLDVSEKLRSWLFCLAFVSIGLESNFRELWRQLVGGKPIILYIVGQSFNIVLTLFAAWLAFGGVLFERVFK
jgi:uncharacterized integral membrane protein (TIGR00698 family)